MSGIKAPLTASLSDRCRIENHPGEGGMAAVYLARDLKRDHTVALGVTGPELARTLGGAQ